jgi:integrase
VAVSMSAPSAIFWTTVRKLLIENPKLCADMTGLPTLISWANHSMPKPPIKLEKLKTLYLEHSQSKRDTKSEAANVFQDFIDFTQAVTLDDVTAEKLTGYRERMNKQGHAPGTVAAYFGRVKYIIRFAKSEGEDAAQIDSALSRMAILKAPKDEKTHTPSPISPADFQAVHKAAGGWDEWQTRLLVMLNCCLHFDEMLDVEWADFNLDAGTFCTKRNKRGRVIRASTLWSITLDALKTIRRTGSTYVFTSSHGKRYNAKGQWKTWNKIRIAAGLPHIQLDDIRDGAYTAACNAAGVEDKVSSCFAGHSHGMKDRYVERNPALVKPACDAVYNHYFGPVTNNRPKILLMLLGTNLKNPIR